MWVFSGLILSVIRWHHLHRKRLDNMTYIREVAIAGVVILEAIALQQGVDGALFSVVIAVIVYGLVGYTDKSQKIATRNNNAGGEP